MMTEYSLSLQLTVTEGHQVKGQLFMCDFKMYDRDAFSDLNQLLLISHLHFTFICVCVCVVYFCLWLHILIKLFWCTLIL